MRARTNRRSPGLIGNTGSVEGPRARRSADHLRSATVGVEHGEGELALGVGPGGGADAPFQGAILTMMDLLSFVKPTTRSVRSGATGRTTHLGVFAGSTKTVWSARISPQPLQRALRPRSQRAPASAALGVSLRPSVGRARTEAAGTSQALNPLLLAPYVTSGEAARGSPYARNLRM